MKLITKPFFDFFYVLYIVSKSQRHDYPIVYKGGQIFANILKACIFCILPTLFHKVSIIYFSNFIGFRVQVH